MSLFLKFFRKFERGPHPELEVAEHFSRIGGVRLRRPLCQAP